MAKDPHQRNEPSRLLPCFFPAANDGLVSNSIMLCEVVGDEIQSISLRVAADAISRSSPLAGRLRPENG